MTSATAEELINDSKDQTIVAHSSLDRFSMNLYDSYARSLVRLLAFGTRCESGHPCVLEEIRIFKQHEKRLKQHLLHSYPGQLVFEKTMRELILGKVEILELDEENEKIIKEMIFNLDLSNLRII